jgi:hypothetical protein
MTSPYIEREAKRLNIGHKPTETNDCGVYIPDAEPEIVPLAIRMHSAFPYILAAILLAALALEYFVA